MNAEIYEFTDYIEAINSDRETIWLCPSQKMAKVISDTALIKIYEFYEAIDGSYPSRVEAILSHEEWERIKGHTNATLLFREEAALSKEGEKT